MGLDRVLTVGRRDMNMTRPKYEPGDIVEAFVFWGDKTEHGLGVVLRRLDHDSSDMAECHSKIRGSRMTQPWNCYELYEVLVGAQKCYHERSHLVPADGVRDSHL